MYELKKKRKGIFISKSLGTGHSSYEKRIYWYAVSQRLRYTGLELDLDSDRHRIHGKIPRYQTSKSFWWINLWSCCGGRENKPYISREPNHNRLNHSSHVTE